jgi:hypothetical protein
MHVFRVYPGGDASIEKELSIDLPDMDNAEITPNTTPPVEDNLDAASDIEAPIGHVGIGSDDISDMDVYSLDFSQVGLKFWKVKVKIGFTYDFSDFKTFIKSLREGRICDTDLLSHDGADWTPINEIEDLEAYFCRLYVKLEKGIEETGEVPKAKKKAMASANQSMGSGINDLASAIADAEEEVSTSFAMKPGVVKKTTSTSINRPVRKKRKPVAPPNKNLPPLALICILAVVIVGGGLFMMRDSDKEEVTDSPEITVASTANEAESKKLQKKNDLLLKNKGNLPKEPEVKEEENFEGKKARIPQEVLDQMKAGKSPTSEKKTKTAKDYALEGAALIKKGKYKSAIASYKMASSKSSNGDYLERYGYSLYKAEKVDAAIVPLKNACDKKNYKKACTLLATIYSDLGDDAAANTYRNKGR